MSAIRMSEAEWKEQQAKRGKLVAVPVAKPKRAQRTGPSELEVRFWQQWGQTCLPMPEREWYFMADRGFRFDFAWPSLMLAIEVQGMAHRIKERFEADIEKRALAQLNGWTVLEVSGTTIRDGRALDWAKVLYADRVLKVIKGDRP